MFGDMRDMSISEKLAEMMAHADRLFPDKKYHFLVAVAEAGQGAIDFTGCCDDSTRLFIDAFNRGQQIGANIDIRGEVERAKRGS
jgi:hypothetical protein